MDLRRTKPYKAITDPAVPAATVWSMFDVYITTGKNINLRDHNTGETYLHIVVSNPGKFCTAQGVSAVYRLAVGGADLNTTDNGGDTCLHRVVRSAGVYRIVVALIRCGADPLVRDTSGRTAEDILRQDRPEGWEETLHWLCKFHPGLYNAVAVKQTNIPNVERLLKYWCKTTYVRNGAMLNVLDVADGTEDLNDDVIRLLRSYAATNEFALSMLAGVSYSCHSIADIDLNTRDQSHQVTSSPQSPDVPQPLLAAAWDAGRDNSVEILLRAGADTGALYSGSGELHDRQPLFFHLLQKDPGRRPADHLVYRILAASNMAARNQKGQTVLYKAISYDYPDHFIRLLIQYGANLASRDRKGRTARDYAAQMKRTEQFHAIDNHVLDLIGNSHVAELERLVLWSYEHILDLTDDRGFNLAKILREHPVLSREMGRFLWKISAIQCHLDNMFHAAESGSAEELRKFISQKFSTARDKCGRTVLHRAIKRRSKEIIKLIVETYPGIIDAPDTMGMTPLHYAYLIKGGLNLAGYLLFKGADPTVTDVAGRLAEDYTIEKQGQDEYLKLQTDIETFSMDVYLEETNFERSLIRAIRSMAHMLHKVNDLDHVRVLVEGLGDKGDINRHTGLLFHCVDSGMQDAAVYLIRRGMRTDIYKQYEMCDPNSSSCTTFTCNHRLVSLQTRAKRRKCQKVLDAIEEISMDMPTFDGSGRILVKNATIMDQFATLGLV